MTDKEIVGWLIYLFVVAFIWWCWPHTDYDVSNRMSETYEESNNQNED